VMHWPYVQQLRLVSAFVLPDGHRIVTYEPSLLCIADCGRKLQSTWLIVAHQFHKLPAVDSYA